MRKDLEIVQREAQALRALTPVSDLAMQLYRACESMGHGDHDFSAVAELYRNL
jgi:3-hydroxyisobutyrate dehydrogenase-like beta-hydroxyacid dehydrogenase